MKTQKKQKRVNNEVFAYNMVKAGKTYAQIRNAFKKRYPDATAEFLTKRTRIYIRIAERKLEAERKAANS